MTTTPPKVIVDDIWLDRDKRMGNRRVRIVEVRALHAMHNHPVLGGKPRQISIDTLVKRFTLVRRGDEK